jgi:hypothetical protein
MIRHKCLLLVVTLSCVRPALAGDEHVRLVKVPGKGIQPQAVVDAQGNLHLIYFEGDPRGGDLQYIRREAGAREFTAPVRVNSQHGSAVAAGTIRGGQLAVGRGGRVHVAWNGAMKAVPRNPIAGHPMLYTRLNDAGSAFEPQRNLMTKSAILDGGGTVAADARGNVYVAWHAEGQDLPRSEAQRRVWVSISTDDGATFAAEKPAWDEPTGACGCCGMRGFADQAGNAYFLYRAATRKSNRGMYLLHSSDRGLSFAGRALDQWRIDTCPMSSEVFAEGPTGVYAAWDNAGQVFFCRVGPGAAATPQAAPGLGGERRHPALACNARGEMILAWTEGTGWNRGGGLAWQLYDEGGKPRGDVGRRAGAVPVWGLPTAIGERDGHFIIFH